MAEAQQMSTEKKTQPESIKSARFHVVEGNMLKIRANATDVDSAANERALVCAVRFLDDQGTIIETPYTGTSSSAVFGSYVYIASHSDDGSATWIKEVIIAPTGASVLEVGLYPWKTSERIRVVDEIECLDIRRIPTDEFSWNLNAAESKEETYDVLPFWRSLFSFDVLRKATVTSGDIRIKIQFFGCDNGEIETKDAKAVAVVGTVSADDKLGGFLVAPDRQQCEYEGYEREMAVVQLIPPLAAVKALVKIGNDADFYSVRVSLRVHAFESLIESRFAADSGQLIANSHKLPYDLADLSFTKLLEKRGEDISACGAALEFYLACGTVKKITSAANHILNRLQDANLRTKARYALSEVKKTKLTWLPSVAGMVTKTSFVAKISSALKVAHFLNGIAKDGTEENIGSEWKLVRSQEMVTGGEPVVITPLGYPEKGQQGEPWERCVHEDIACFYLNCLSVEQLEMIPVTSSLNFMAVLAGHILMDEGVDLIHVQEGERDCNSALVGLALGRAMHIPVVYHKSSFFEGRIESLGEQQTLNQARFLKDYQCMFDADAVIVSSERQRAVLSELGISDRKVFVVPLGESGGNTENSSLYGTNNIESCQRAYAYAQSANLKKYQ